MLQRGRAHSRADGACPRKPLPTDFREVVFERVQDETRLVNAKQASMRGIGPSHKGRADERGAPVTEALEVMR